MSFFDEIAVIVQQVVKMPASSDKNSVKKLRHLRFNEP